MAILESKRLLISDLISVATIELRLRGRQRDDVLNELVGRIPEIAARPEAKQTLLRALQEREQLHSTGIGDGVALPHARDGRVLCTRRVQPCTITQPMAPRALDALCASPVASPALHGVVIRAIRKRRCSSVGRAGES